MEKKRIIKRYEKLSPDLQERLKEIYPYGYSNKLLRLNNSKNETFFAVPLETDDTYYMVKVQVEKIKKFEDSEDEFHFSVGDEGFDNPTNDSSDDDDAGAYDDDSKDPSYTPSYDDDPDI